MPIVTLRVNDKNPKFSYFVISVHYKKLGSGLKPSVPKYRLHPLSRLEDIVKKVCTVVLKPTVGL